MLIYIAAWSVFSLGVIHTVFGLVRFRKPFADAMSEGFVNRFRTSDAAVSNLRGGAYWFTVFGPMLLLAGHLAVLAAGRGDLETIKILGLYMFVLSIPSLLAFPKSGFWATLVLAPVLIALGFGWIS